MVTLSLRDKLVLAFLGLLLFSFALTGTMFWLRVQEYTTELTLSNLRIAASSLRVPIQRVLIDASIRDKPLSVLAPELEPRLRLFPGVALLLTSQKDDRVIYPKDDPPTSRLPIHYPAQPAGEVGQLSLPNCFSSAGHTYACVAEPAQHHIARFAIVGFAAPTNVNNAIFIEARDSVQAEAARLLLVQMAGAVAAAVAVALAIAFLLVRYITRPLLRMTAASEAMAAGDYNQYIPLSSHDEVGQLARSFNKMAYEVQRARQAQREFVANISHDLKTPLTSIIGFSQILSDREVAPPMTDRAIQVINQEARRMQRMTQDLLELAQLEAGQLSMQRRVLDLTALLGDILSQYMTLRPRPDIELRDLRTSECLSVLGDADRLTQVIVNLLDNAIKFCRAGGHVELASERRQGEACFWITNTGEGLVPAEVHRVFDRFYRTDHARANVEGGTGLGLAIVREIVLAHNGRVWAESERGEKVRFIVALPLVPDALPLSPSPSSASAAP